MTPQQVKASICALFEVKEEEGVLFIQTPLSNLANDSIVVYATGLEDGGMWRVDDNGETAFSLSLAGCNITTDAFSETAGLLCKGSAVSWNADDLDLSMTVEPKDIGIASIIIATTASKIITAVTAKKERGGKSDFKDKLMALLAEISTESGRKADFDVYIDGELLKADCKIDTPTPTFIIAATSSERLTEAELIHSRLKINKEPGYVLAVVESIDTVGKSHYRRANYFTDKAIEYDDAMFGSLIRSRFVHSAPASKQ